MPKKRKKKEHTKDFHSFSYTLLYSLSRLYSSWFFNYSDQRLNRNPLPRFFVFFFVPTSGGLTCSASTSARTPRPNRRISSFIKKQL